MLNSAGGSVIVIDESPRTGLNYPMTFETPEQPGAGVRTPGARTGQIGGMSISSDQDQGCITLRNRAARQ
ncbi:hypothetical protein D6850_01365 [Roseovarius spongiae]|uniref:Uncharacterized protein n=1 Tax=Roseovarius spongiae TaxID=2320272 RepID=A0A3A8AVG0_9RHOB|nr:hypothetical protein D6850_01365 [Roseovarius spongiae]